MILTIENEDSSLENEDSSLENEDSSLENDDFCDRFGSSDPILVIHRGSGCGVSSSFWPTFGRFV